MKSLALAIVAALLIFPAGSTARATQHTTTSSASYYLALGDSDALGFQADLDFQHGYVQDLYRRLLQQPQNVGLTLNNLACALESTATMLGQDGTTCPNWQYTSGMTTTPQITQAVTFLGAHRGQVRLITLDIGATDFEPLLKTPSAQLLATTLQHLTTNLDQIFTTLQAAAPSVPIFTMTYYNPYVTSPYTGTVKALLNQVVLAVNEVILHVAEAHGVQVARVYVPFATLIAVSPNPHATICALTWMCSSLWFYPLTDPHPTTIGYQFIANIFWQAGVQNY